MWRQPGQTKNDVDRECNSSVRTGLCGGSQDRPRMMWIGNVTVWSGMDGVEATRTDQE